MNWVTTHFEIELVTLIALVAAVIVVQQRRSPQSAAAWLLSIAVLPYVAIPVFLALGFRKRFASIPLLKFTSLAGAPVAADPPAIECVLQRLGAPAATGGNRFELMSSPDLTYERLFALIGGAEHSIDTMFYQVARDTVGTAFVTALTERAAAGVHVRLLMDWIGSFSVPHAALKRLRAAGGEVRYFLPKSRLFRISHLNLRNHRKMVIIDGQTVFSGSMNIGDRYMAERSDDDHWVDLAYVLQGPALQSHCDVFRSDWRTSGGDVSSDLPPVPDPGAGSAVTQLVAAGPDVRHDPLHDGFVNAVHAATRQVWLVTPYFVPTELLSHALAVAARRGVDVRIFLPANSDQKLTDFARGAYVRDLQEAGCTLLFFGPGMIHAKAGLIDDAGFVGSANFDVRSMLLNFETMLFVYDPASRAMLSSWFRRMEPQCRTGIGAAGIVRRVAEGIFRLGAPIL